MFPSPDAGGPDRRSVDFFALLIPWIAVGVVEGSAAWLVMAPAHSILYEAAAAALHVAASVASAALFRVQATGEDRLSAYFIGGLVVFTLPIVGVTAVWYTMREARRAAAREGEGLAKVSIQERPPTPDSGPGPLSVRRQGVELNLFERVASDVQIQPVVDYFQMNDPLLRMSAIEVLTRLSGPNIVSVLRNLLIAPDADLRFQASVALTRIEDRHNRKIKEASNNALAVTKRDRPEPPVELARAYMEYVRSGLPESTTAAHYARMAGNEFERARENGALDEGFALELAEAWLLAGEHRRCLAALEGAERAGAAPERIVLLRMRVYYELGQYGRVQEMAREVRQPVEDPETRRLIDWWAGRAGQPVQGPMGATP